MHAINSTRLRFTRQHKRPNCRILTCCRLRGTHRASREVRVKLAAERACDTQQTTRSKAAVVQFRPLSGATRHTSHTTAAADRCHGRGLPRAAGGVSTTTCLLADGRGGRSTGRCDPILPGPRSRTEPTGPWRLPSGTACCTIPCTPVLVIFCRVSVTPGPPCRSSVKLVPSEPEFALGERVGAVR